MAEVAAGQGLTTQTGDPWEGPYVPSLMDRPSPEIWGGWLVPLALAAGLFVFWLAMRWRETRKRELEATRKLAGQLHRLGEPLTRGERRLLRTSLRRMKPEERERLLNEPTAMQAHFGQYPAGDPLGRDAIGRKLSSQMPIRTESLPEGTRVSMAVDGFPGHFDAMVSALDAAALTFVFIEPPFHKIPFEQGDLVTVALSGVRPEQAFVTRIIECADDGKVMACRLSHGDILPARAASRLPRLPAFPHSP